MPMSLGRDLKRSPDKRKSAIPLSGRSSTSGEDFKQLPACPGQDTLSSSVQEQNASSGKKSLRTEKCLKVT